MRSLILAVVLFFSAFAAKAQQFANTTLFYGNLSYNNVNDRKLDGETYRLRAFSITPGVGYQISNHFTLGVSTLFSSVREQSPTLLRKYTDFAVGPFVRYSYYFSKHLFFFAQAGTHYLTGQERTESRTDSLSGPLLRYNGILIDITPSLGIHFRRGLAINFGFGGINYQAVNGEGDGRHKDVLDFTLGQEFRIGVSKNFIKRPSKQHAESTQEVAPIDIKDDEEPAGQKKDEE